MSTSVTKQTFNARQSVLDETLICNLNLWRLWIKAKQSQHENTIKSTNKDFTSQSNMGTNMDYDRLQIRTCDL